MIVLIPPDIFESHLIHTLLLLLLLPCIRLPLHHCALCIVENLLCYHPPPTSTVCYICFVPARRIGSSWIYLD